LPAILTPEVGIVVQAGGAFLSRWRGLVAFAPVPHGHKRANHILQWEAAR